MAQLLRMVMVAPITYNCFCIMNEWTTLLTDALVFIKM